MDLYDNWIILPFHSHQIVAVGVRKTVALVHYFRDLRLKCPDILLDLFGSVLDRNHSVLAVQVGCVHAAGT